MERFHVIEDGAVILRGKKGLFRQTKVYARGREVFAAYGGGFIRLLARHGTTNPDVTWLDIEAPGVALDARDLPILQTSISAVAA